MEPAEKKISLEKKKFRDMKNKQEINKLRQMQAQKTKFISNRKPG